MHLMQLDKASHNVFYLGQNQQHKSVLAYLGKGNIYNYEFVTVKV